MIYQADSKDFYGRTGDVARFMIGILIVAVVGFSGIIFAPGFGLAAFWPYAGIWAAIGWASSRLSIKSSFLLVVLGIFVDLLSDAPLGCWAAIHLIAYFSASIFRKRAQTDQTGFVRLIGGLTALFVAFGAARWIMGAYLGDMATQDILGGFLVTALLFLPVRPFFLLKKEEWVDA